MGVHVVFGRASASADGKFRPPIGDDTDSDALYYGGVGCVVLE